VIPDDSALWDGAVQVLRLNDVGGWTKLQPPGARFAEYFEPFTGEPLGSLDQSWTAAVALDLLAGTS
jgi:hypothetical protein